MELYQPAADTWRKEGGRRMAEHPDRIPVWYVAAALAVLGLQVVVLAWQRQAAVPMGVLFWQDGAHGLLAILLTGLLLDALIRPAVVTAALAVKATLRARRGRRTWRTMLRLGALWVIALGALAAAAVTFSVDMTGDEILQQAGDLWADFWTPERCVYEGPLEDSDATDTWEIHSLNASGSDPEARGGPVLYHYLLSDRQEAPYSFLCPNALVEGLAKCDGYSWAYLAVTYRMGIPCSVTEGPNHAWNAVWLGGQLRHIDVTWLDRGETIGGPWFLMTTEQRQETVEITSDLDSVTKTLLLEGAGAP